MTPIEIGALAAAALMTLIAGALASKLAAARRALAQAEEKLNRPAPVPPRLFESRREQFGLLWYPILTVKDSDRLVVGAVAGLPHCARCARALSVSAGPPEEWSCAGCGDKRPGSAADIQVTDTVIKEALSEFLRRNEGYRAAPGVGAPRRAPV